MANELKITDVVEQKAITQLQNLKKEIDESYNSYKNFIELLAKGMQDKPASFQDLSNKSANYNKVLNELISTQNKLADLQKEHETLLQRITQKTKENVAQILAEAWANAFSYTHLVSTATCVSASMRADRSSFSLVRISIPKSGLFKI